MAHNLNIYKGKRVLLTGHTGYKGAWLALWLKQLGAEVMGYALPPKTDDDLYVAANVKDVLAAEELANLNDAAALNKAFEAFQPEVVLHLAAQALVRESYTNPKETFDTNVAGSVNVLEAVRKTPSVRALVYVTSDKCYKNNEWIWGYRECDELGGHDPYSASKAAAELVLQAYANAYFTPNANIGIASARAGNVIGAGDWATDRIVPDCVRALKTGASIPLRNPHATRPWQHVLEPLGGYLLLGAKLLDAPKAFSGAWNFGPHAEGVHTVEVLANALVQHWGSGSTEVLAEKDAPHEAGLLHLNCDKAHQLLNWQPVWNFAQTAQKVSVGYKAMVEGADARAVALEQINEYASAFLAE